MKFYTSTASDASDKYQVCLFPQLQENLIFMQEAPHTCSQMLFLNVKRVLGVGSLFTGEQLSHNCYTFYRNHSIDICKCGICLFRGFWECSQLFMVNNSSMTAIGP